LKISPRNQIEEAKYEQFISDFFMENNFNCNPDDPFEETHRSAFKVIKQAPKEEEKTNNNCDFLTAILPNVN
jgi:hypothetical protein